MLTDENYARELYFKAAELGYAPSQYKIGSCYEYGQLGLPIDPKESIKWYQQAAEKGYPDAELALSGWFLTGAEGVLPQSDTEAYLWARRAAEQGLAKAQYAVGYYSENGVGVRADVEEARRWYAKAAGQGNARAVQRLNELKKMVRSGDGAKGQRDSRKKDGDCLVM